MNSSVILIIYCILVLECHSSIKCDDGDCLQHSRYNLTELLVKCRQCAGHNPIYTASLGSLDSF